MTPLHFEDLVVGQQFRSAAATMDRDRLVEFAAEFDPQPQHLDEEQARSSHFGTLVASGWHTASLTMRMQIEALFGRFPGGAMGAQVDKLAWRRPVHPGDILHAVIEVLALRPSRSRPGQGIVTTRTEGLKHDGTGFMTFERRSQVPTPESAR